MGVSVLAWCPKCNEFVKSSLPITGEGATLVVKGAVHVTCPKCKQEATAPGGGFKVDREQMTRLSSNLTNEQADELRDRLTKWRDAGMPLEVLEDIIQQYAPELRGLIRYARKQTHGQIPFGILLFVLLMTLVQSCQAKVDINRLLDQIREAANEEVHRL